MNRILYFLLLITPFSSFVQAQERQVTKSANRTVANNALVTNISFTNIGPSIMSGRVTDLAVNPDDPTKFYVAYASGGLWYTKNNGTSFTPVMDSATTQNIGAIAVDWNTNTIWVGTGESNASRSSYAGIGILKSTDSGTTWEQMGLLDSHHIGKILIDPKNPDILVVAVTGHLYTPNKERGIYRTEDGGKTWKQTLYKTETAGGIDITADPRDFDTLYASLWQKDRKAWNFSGNGEASGIYKSLDGGKTWKIVTTAKSGFPIGEAVGRIGLSAFDANTIYALLDNQAHRKEEAIKEEKLQKRDFEKMTEETFLQLPKKQLDIFLKENNFQEKYRAENVKQMVRNEEITPRDVLTYLEDANGNLFDTPVIGAEVYRSDDGGATWVKTHKEYIDDLFYSYGYYFSQIRVNPKDPNHIYIMGVPILQSLDGGKTFESLQQENVHADHHALWINPKNPNHLINGNDGGVNLSYDSGKHWIKANQPAVGQFYAIQVDNQKPYNVYGGLQDNGVWMAPHTTVENPEWHQTGRYPWKRLMGGDGMQIEVAKKYPYTIYTGYQFGNYSRINPNTKKRVFIQPKHELGEKPYRFNWQTPILLSAHNDDILYFGANKLLRSMNQGDDWTVISKDLTKGAVKGNVAFGTITSISESPLQFGLLYTGSDDGLVHVSKDGGASWQIINKGLPDNLWVSRIVASAHELGTVYVTLNGYRNDDFAPYVYRSKDFGTTWTKIHEGLPDASVNVIREDSKRKEILYLGTDNSAFVSMNQGVNWQAFESGLPKVAVHDIKLQKRTGDLLLGTHGRSIYKTNIEALQAFNDTIAKKELHIFDIDTIKWSPNWGNYWSVWNKKAAEKLPFSYFAKEEGEGVVKILSEDSIVVQQFDLHLFEGINNASYNLSITEKARKVLKSKDKDLQIERSDNKMYYLSKGTYTLEVSMGKYKEQTKFVVK